VHSDGEIYGGVLWDLRQALIAARGFTEGTLIADRLILQHLLNMSGGGMLDTDDFIEGRGALLSADSTLYGGAYECLIWRVFAGREIGSGATAGNPPGTPPTISTALPAQCTGAATVAFSKGAYTCANPDSGTLTVSDPNGGAVTTVAVTTASGDSETLALSWAGGTGSTAAFNVRIGAAVPGDGQVQIAAQGERILASYADNPQ
jgi:extracellular elastinolytic metalloproteinase